MHRAESADVFLLLARPIQVQCIDGDVSPFPAARLRRAAGVEDGNPDNRTKFAEEI